MARILVVDDEPDIRLLAKVNLELDGHEVLVAGDGEQALVAVADSTPDLVVLDVMMPAVDGWTVLERMKSDATTAISEIPVLMLTALGNPLDRARGGIEGAVRYLTKPIDLDELRRAVRDALEGSEPQQRREARTAALELIARVERDAPPSLPADAPRPRLTGLERVPTPTDPSRAPNPVRAAAERLGTLTDKQRALLDAIAEHPTVLAASEALSMSRSNVYASLRRIARKLGVRSVPELLSFVRHHHLLG
jgi:DNA-binding response OmpR family regulator